MFYQEGRKAGKFTEGLAGPPTIHGPPWTLRITGPDKKPVIPNPAQRVRDLLAQASFSA